MGDKPFFVKSEADMAALEKWLKGRGYDSISLGHKDKKGNRMIGLGKDRNPNSDWSKTDPRGLVIILSESAYNTAYETIRRVGGFKDSDSGQKRTASAALAAAGGE